MIAGRQKLVEEIFKQAIALEPRACDILIESRCGDDAELLAEVRSLLKMARSDAGFLDQTPIVLTDDAAEISPAVPESGMIGPYRIRSVLGSGGMGVVYVAEQARPQRTVALKVIRPELATPSVLRRFEFEAEVLGRLQHPGIAQIIEAGTHETRSGRQPYFAMELVEGTSLIEFCRERGIGMEDRVRLFIRVCEAVEHAHQRGVIHRDLKPANILVTPAGQPKVLDFGVARAVDAGDEDVRLTMVRTGERQLIGTLAYMSPEQVSGGPKDIDTRSDVYALGVVLFELLAGRLPHDLTDKSLPEAVRIRAERDACKLGTLAPRFRGDLDTITAKALERDPARRYASASALADDLQRYLLEQPINARPASAIYQMRKFARRYRGIVAAGLIALACLLAGLVSSTVAWRHATEDRDAARRSATRAEHMASFLRSTLLSINPSTARGHDTTLLREVLGTTRDRLKQDELRDEPGLRAELAGVVGSVYKLIHRPTDAEPLLREALEAELQVPPRVERARLLMQLGYVRLTQGNLAGCFESYEEALRMYEQLGMLGLAEGIDSKRMLAEAWRQSGEMAKANAIMAELVPIAKALQPPEDVLVARCLQSWGLAKSDMGDHAAAERMLTEAAAQFEKQFGPEDYALLTTISSIAADQHEQGRYEEAEKNYRRSLAGFRKVLGTENLQTSNEMANLALTLINLNRLDEASPILREAVAIDRKFAGPRSPMFANHLTTLGTLLRQQGMPVDAEAAYKEALPILEATVGPNHIFTTDVLENLAQLAGEREQYASAFDLVGEAVERSSAAQRADPPWKLTLRTEQASYLIARAIQQLGEGNTNGALEHVHRARSLLENAMKEDGAKLDSNAPALLGTRFTLGRSWLVESDAMRESATQDERLELLHRAMELCTPYVEQLEHGPSHTAPVNYQRYASEGFDCLIEVLERTNSLERSERSKLGLESMKARKERVMDRVRTQAERAGSSAR